jgi:hypothetical protein
MLIFSVFPIQVFAYDIDYRLPGDSSGTDYAVTIKVGGSKNSGTDGDGVKVRYSFHDGSSKEYELDQPGEDDLEKNDLCKYTVRINKPPYMLKKVEIINRSSDALCINYIVIYVKNALNTEFHYNDKWIEGKGSSHDQSISKDISSYTKRKVSGAGNFNSVFNQLVYIDEGIDYAANKIDFKWDGKISDQYGSGYQFNTTYKLHIPELKVAVVGNGIDNKYTNPNDFISLIAPAPNNTGFSVHMDNISNQMRNKAVNKLTITPTLNYYSASTHSFNGGFAYSGKIEVIRKNFEVSKIIVVNDNETFKAYTDNYYFNNSTNQIKLKLEVATGINNDNYNAVDIAKNISGDFHLIYKGNKEYVEPIEIKSEGKYIFLTFPVPQDNDNDDSFLKLKMHRVTSKSGNVEDFKLLNINGIYEETVIRDLSDYKVDTKISDLSLTKDISDSWQNTIEFGVRTTENLYPNNNVPRADKDAGYFLYTLYDSASYALSGEKATSINIKSFGSNKGSTGSHVAPRLDSTNIKLQLMNKEEGNYVLTLSGYDYAGNRMHKEYINILLDNKAPSVAFNAIEQAQNPIDNSRTAEYRFMLNDLSETGLAYYCFVRDGETIPTIGAASNVSGKIDAIIGKWAFIEQAHSSATTVTLKLNKGESFKGRLYYFAKDSSENSTAEDNKEIRQNGIDYITGYNYTDIDFNNQSIDHSMIVGSYSYPQSNYDIKFDYASGNSIKYRWIGYTPIRNYTNQDVGSGLQLNGSNQEILLNGECTLEYTIIASNGNYATYTRSLVFDNKAPNASMTFKNSGTINNSHTFILNASDTSGIKTASYYITDANNNNVHNPPIIYSNASVNINNGLVNTSVSLENIKNGTYKLVFTAVDNNGLESIVESSPIYVRSSAPDVQSNVSINNTLNDSYLSSSNDYSITLDVTEHMNNANLFLANQYVNYRVSKDGINYSEWVNATMLEANDNSLYATFKIDNPTALNEGENTIYIQVANTSFTDNLSKLSANMITTLAPIKIIYDSQGPEYNISLNDGNPTTDNIIGTITLQDMLTNNEDLQLISDDRKVIVSEPMVDELTGLKNNFIITITDNFNNYIIARDKAGNETRIPISILSIDRESPSLLIAPNDSDINGDRIDASGFIDVSGALADNTRFALINLAEYNGELSEEFFNYDSLKFSTIIDRHSMINNEDSFTSYYYSLKGLNGNYKIGVYAVDHLGNETLEVLPETISVMDAEAELEYNIASYNVIDNATVLLNFNVPVYVLPQRLQQNLETDELTDEFNEELALIYSDKYSMIHSFITPENGIFKLYVADECGRSYTFEIEVSDVTFTHEVPFHLELKNINNLSEIYDLNLVHADDPNYGAMLLYLSFDSEHYNNYALFPLNLDSEDPPPATTSLINTRSTSSVVNTMINSSSTSPAAIQSYSLTDDGFFDEESKDFSYRSYYSLAHPTQDGFTSLVYGSKNTINFDKKFHFIIRKYSLINNELTWIDSYESISINFLDSTLPKISYSINKTNVTSGTAIASLVTLTASDAETGIKSLKYYFSDEPHDGQGTGYQPVYNNEVEVTRNGYLFIIAENNVGMENKIMIDINDIMNDPIIYGGDYIVSYYYQNYSGDWMPVVDGVYYKNVKAVVSFLDSELYINRGLYILNNSSSPERILTAYDNSFEFEIADRHGYIDKHLAFAYNFDLSPPEITYTIDKTAKTKENITITITASDDKGSVDNLMLETIDQEAIPVTFISADGNKNIYTATIEKSASYIITAYDEIGNKATKSFVVTNIDKSSPEIISLSYNTKALTNQSVSVQITNYSKPGVTITKTEPVGPLTSNDYQVSISNNLFTFTKNGSISVFFKDEYGNEGSDIISVDNIFREPPSLIAVAETAENLLSVKVSFEKKTIDGIPIDEFRELSDFFVSYNGIVYPAHVAEFTLIENRTYSFKIYDFAGMVQYIDLVVSDIDKSIPKITEVSWSYYYFNEEEQKWILAEDSIIPGTEAGYRVANDIYPATSRNVTVKLITDKKTTYVGAPKDDETSLSHELEYSQNGLFNFSLKAANELSTSYGVEIAIIDKTPPKIEFINPLELMFIEGGTTYDKEMLNDFIAYDVFNGVKTILNDKVIIDWGGFDPDNINNNTFDRSKPYYISYKVYDSVGNYTEFRRTITLVGFYDTISLINGIMPDATNSVIIEADSFDVSLYNFSGTAYVKYASGQYTMGQMKTRGTVVTESAGAYSFKKLSKGWYTIYIQTDKRDYFNVYVYVSGIDK